MPTRVMVVFGTRPEAVKVAPIVRELNASQAFDCTVAVTGQHRHMLDQINDSFGIVPDVDLDVFAAGQGPSQIAAKTLTSLDPVLETHEPHTVLVQGDTTTALAAGLAAFYQHIPVVHVEAGLRSGSLWSPFPEEANRRMLSQIATLHLCPTAANRDNLLAEGIDPATITVTGNPVIDALRLAVTFPHTVTDPLAAAAVKSPGPLVLVTSHRRESWGEPMERTALALARLADQEPHATFLFPIHKNPIVRDIFFPVLRPKVNVVLTEPLDYLDLAQVLSASTLILTDSGGLQEEGPSLGKPVLVLRDNTERPEGIAAGTAKLVGTDPDRIVAETAHLLHDQAAYAAMATAINPYGDGLAARRSLAALAACFANGARLEDFDPTSSAP
ncbi:MAG: UDP-N-acetylglucosamine 2-epimerase (non-hydrolyzing) [Micrococcales bacterium]|nr:UDP-N-acetylglucosamine 2-epimerase (non-hydrolyzing) [Micrococcales bacterium]